MFASFSHPKYSLSKPKFPEKLKSLGIAYSNRPQDALSISSIPRPKYVCTNFDKKCVGYTSAIQMRSMGKLAQKIKLENKDRRRCANLFCLGMLLMNMITSEIITTIAANLVKNG